MSLIPLLLDEILRTQHLQMQHVEGEDGHVISSLPLVSARRIDYKRFLFTFGPCLVKPIAPDMVVLRLNDEAQTVLMVGAAGLLPGQFMCAEMRLTPDMYLQALSLYQRGAYMSAPHVFPKKPEPVSFRRQLRFRGMSTKPIQPVSSSAPTPDTPKSPKPPASKLKGCPSRHKDTCVAMYPECDDCPDRDFL